MQLRRLPALACLAIFLLSAAAFAPAFASDVHTDYDHKAVWERYHTFSWQKIKTSNPFYVDRIHDSVIHYLEQQGWKYVPSGGDVSLFAISNVRNQRSLQTFYNGYGGGWGWGGYGGWGGWGWGPGYTTTVPVHQRIRHVVIDMYDAKTRQLLWRGAAVDDLSRKSEKNEQQLYRDFAAMFHNFPPKQ
ncbi:MAG: DUF4136 domain-containing protein [Acidobacteriaceae bacterium]